MLLGPLFRFELVRLARRGTHLPLRLVLAALLFVGLLTSYVQLFPSADVFALLFGGGEAADPSRLNKFGETFLFAFLLIQQVAVLLLTPVYAGGAIAEEKEKGRFDFLLTSSLGRWELVLGKLAARLVFVLGVVAVGLPVLSLTLLFGGVDPGRVLAGFVVSVVSAVAVGSFAVMLSVLRPTLRDVLVWAFGGLAASGAAGLIFGCVSNGNGMVLSPVTVLIPLFREWGEQHTPATDPTWPMVGGYAAVFLPLAGVFVLVAVAHVRTAVVRGVAHHNPFGHPPAEPDTPADPPTLAAPPPPEWYRPPQRVVFADGEIDAAAEGREFLVPGLGDREDPLEWKERHFGARLPLLEGRLFALARGCAVFAFLCVLGIGGFVGFVTAVQNGYGGHRVTNGLARVVLTVSAAVLPFAGLRAAAGVANERAKGTLESLFVLPLDRSAILWAKAVAAARSTRWWAVGSAAAVTLAATTGGLHALCLPGLAAVYCGYAAFTLGVGVFLGVVCKTGVRAVLAHLTVSLVTFVGPLLLSPWTGWPTVVLSPPFGLGVGTSEYSPTGDGPTSERWVACLAFPVGLVYLWVGVIAWRMATRLFERA